MSASHAVEGKAVESRWAGIGDPCQYAHLANEIGHYITDGEWEPGERVYVRRDGHASNSRRSSTTSRRGEISGTNEMTKLRFDADALTAGGTGGYSLLQFDAIPDLTVAHLSGPAGGHTLNDPNQTASYTKAFQPLTWHALDPTQSARKIIQMANR
jgi:hypothetical protein